MTVNNWKPSWNSAIQSWFLNKKTSLNVPFYNDPEEENVVEWYNSKTFFYVETVFEFQHSTTVLKKKTS